MVPLPSSGRVFERRRRVRLGDVGIAGEIRVDAVARYLQDIARDDSADADLPDPMAWVVRRSTVDCVRPPVFQEEVTLTTWCSGVGSRWAERRTSIVGSHGSRVETATIWVHVDARTGRPAKLGEAFAVRYAEAAGGRVVDARLAHEPRPPDLVAPSPWPWRASDFDLLGHVNNAAYAQAVAEVLARGGRPMAGLRAELEYRDAALPGSRGELVVTEQDGEIALWVLADGRTSCTATLTFADRAA
jgi:acyl-ACP thioesterase